MQLGGHGVISVTANVAAREWPRCANWQQKGILPRHALLTASDAITQQTICRTQSNPGEWACKELGLVATDTLRLPMTPSPTVVVRRSERRLSMPVCCKFREI